MTASRIEPEPTDNGAPWWQIVGVIAIVCGAWVVFILASIVFTG